MARTASKDITQHFRKCIDAPPAIDNVTNRMYMATTWHVNYTGTVITIPLILIEKWR